MARSNYRYGGNYTSTKWTNKTIGDLVKPTVSIKLEGFEELVAKLQAMPAALADEEIRKGVQRATAVVRNEVRNNAPVYQGEPTKYVTPGKLKKAVFMSRDKQYDAGLARMGSRYFVGVRRGARRFFNKKTGAWQKDTSRDAYYWTFLEFGTRFINKQPFLRPAFENKYRDAIDEIKDAIKRGLARLSKKGKI